MGATESYANTNEFFSAEDFSVLQLALIEFADSADYTMLSTHHEVASNSVDPAEKLLAVKLFQEKLGSLLSRSKPSAPVAINRIQGGLNEYIARLSATVEILSGAATPVPNIMHFVWVGGSEVGAIQRDYMNIWREVLKPEQYRFNLWYDSDALLAFEMNRVILDSARIDAMESGGALAGKPGELARMIEDRARVLKHQMFAYIEQPQWRGRADEARIDLMVRAYGKDRAMLEAFRQKCLASHQAMAGSDLDLRDVRQAFAGHFLQDVYQREVAMRGNFAAASDVVRLQAVHLEGGRYSDMDYLPPLADKLGGVDISGFNGEQRLAVLKLLLDHNEALMPGRDALRYEGIGGQIPARHLEALTTFARSKPRALDIFVAPRDKGVPRQAIRLGTAHSDPSRGEMNAHMLAHPGSGMTRSIMEVIRVNYDCLTEVERRMDAAGAGWGEKARLNKVIADVMEEKAARVIALSHADELYLPRLELAILQYYSDGIRPESRGTIVLSGPSAASAGLGKYAATHLQLAQWLDVRDKLKLTQGYNTYTEEELVSGWTVNGTEEDWLIKEVEKWQTGKLKSRYAGQLADLLKEHTLTFKQGWPVLEGKPVLLTSVLQQLMNDLGEPFIRVMKEKLSGDFTFDTAFALDFDTRQQIIAQPDSQIPTSLGVESTSNLNELFTHVAHGSLKPDHLSPMLRVILGGIFGATSLDAAGFASVWQQVSDIAHATTQDGLFARYNAIENAVRQRQPAVNETAPAPGGQPDSHTSRELKVFALTEPLTLNSWRERVEQINRTARREYHAQILKRGGQVRDLFFKAGAISSRQMPQDLLMNTAGDPGRRCYPLALLTASALAQGESAERALIGRVANAGKTPDDADSRALLLALDELHQTPITEHGSARGLLGLEGIVQMLQAKTAPAVMLLDTGNHALLVAKVMQGDTPVLRFYDPNFAIFSFAAAPELTLGMALYLSAGKSAMARLYGLDDIAKAQFNVVELDTTKIASTVLSSNLRLDSFLQSEAIADAQGVSIWEKYSVERTRSVNENARMGAGLAQLDARYWTQEFAQATDLLRAEHKLGPEYLPLLDTVEKTPDAGYSLTMADARHPQNSLKVSTTDARFSKIKQHLQRLVKTLAGEATHAGEADGGSRLSFAFAIQTLITEMRQRDYQNGEGQMPALAIALQVQVYVNYAQLGFGVVSDAVQIARLVQQVSAAEQALRQAPVSGRLVGRAATGVGFVFSLANIGFDIYNLSIAENHEQRSRFSTSLAFNVAALGLDIVALAAGGVVGGAAAILSVPLLGIGIGVTAIASNLGQIRDKATAVGNHLRDIQNAYTPGAYTLENGVLQFPAEAVITGLDLQDNQVRFNSQSFYPWVGGPLELPHYTAAAKHMHRAINIREALELPEVMTLDKGRASDRHTVVLPCTPVCFYGYEYQLGGTGHKYVPKPGEVVAPRAASEAPGPQWYSYLSPLAVAIEAIADSYNDGIYTRYPQLRNSAAYKLEYDKQGNQRFYLYSTPSLKHILYKLIPIHKPTNIEVQLDEHVRQLVVPQLPKEWKQCISYEIVSRSPGIRQLWLTPGLVAVSLRNYAATQWILHAAWAAEKSIRFNGVTLNVDGIPIEGHVDFIELANGELFRLDWKTARLVLVSITLQHPVMLATLSTWNITAGRETSQAEVKERIRRLVAEQRVATAYVPLYKFKVPLNEANQPVFVTAYYDVANAQTFYARNLPEAVNDGVMLAAVDTRHAWFYHPEHATVWRVDAITGTVNRRYRLMNPASGSRIVGCEQTAGGIRVRQTMLEVVSGVETGFEYILTESATVLECIDTSAAWGDYTPRRSVNYWRSLVDRFKTPRDYSDSLSGMAPSVAIWGPAQFVQIRSHVQQAVRDLGWIRLADGLYFHLSRASGLDLDTVMLVWDEGLGDLPLFYSKSAGLLQRGAETDAAQVIASDVIDVSKFGQRYIATREDGLLFEVDKQGVMNFVGVGKHWLRKHTDWLAALPALAETWKAAPFSIIGPGDVSSEHSLAMWCIDGKVLLANITGARELDLVGLTPDKQAAWLLDGWGRLYRQPLMQMEGLRRVFADGSRLLHPEHLPRAEKVWSQWSFAQVLMDGEGLLGQTHEGVNLELFDHQPARIVSFENTWSDTAGQHPEQLQERLRALLSRENHAPFLPIKAHQERYTYYVPKLDRLFEVGGRADGQWAELLGTLGESVALLFDPVDGLIFSREAATNIWLPDSYSHRDGEVLSLEASGEVNDLVAMLPDGVTTLVLAFGAFTSSYRISDEAWQRLDCIVVDSRRPSATQVAGEGTLVLDLANNERLVMSQVDGQLVFSDPDNAHSLIVRAAEPQEGETGMTVQINIIVADHLYTLATQQWLSALAKARGDKGFATLDAVVENV
ncbi:hypothetical protein PS898_04378 [Pseudomonas fluorescens]|nr:hypothetical protein PS898_04378 [Pseudomonas fluorescens]